MIHNLVAAVRNKLGSNQRLCRIKKRVAQDTLIVAIIAPLLTLTSVRLIEHYRHVFSGLSVIQPHLELGKIAKDKKHTIVYKIVNNSDVGINIIGARLSCSCISSSELPMFVAPGSAAEFKIIFEPQNLGSHGHIQRNMQLYTDFKESHVIQLGFTADLT